MSLLFMAGSLLLGWNVAAQTATGDTTEFQSVDNHIHQEVPNTRALLEKIVFIEQEEEVTLDFDTATYLPERFDPHVGNLDQVFFFAMDSADHVELGFEVADYLPKGFEPYLGNLLDLQYRVAPEPVVLTFDTTRYLPEGFEAHLGNWNDLTYAEEAEEVELGFDTAAYLPKHFDPFVGDLDKILFVELDCPIPGACEEDHGIAEIVF